MSKKILKHEVPKPLDAEAISREKIPQEMFQMVSGEKSFDQIGRAYSSESVDALDSPNFDVSSVHRHQMTT